MSTDKREYVNNSIKETERPAVRSDSKTLFQLKKIQSGKFTLAKGCISKTQRKTTKTVYHVIQVLDFLSFLFIFI